MTNDASQQPGRRAAQLRNWRLVTGRLRFAAIACAMLLVIYAALALAAVRMKAPTYDEPIHTMAAYVHATMHDFRFDYENPPLYKYWALLPNLDRPLHVDT